jgi:GrpB-like predicted nucleotidyltransferase (UPF0157 family)/predicted acetyltransferase
MIGLERHTVRVVEYTPDWVDLGIEACRQVREAGGKFIADVQHVGSTAVTDLPAKPILDLAAAAASLDMIPELIEKLTALGYTYRGDGANSGGHLFVWESKPDVRTIHLHVVTTDDVQWKNYIWFRDILRQDSSLRERYAKLKKELGKKFPNDRKSYTDSKDDFIRGVLIQIEKLDLNSSTMLAEILNHDDKLKKAMGSKSSDNTGESFLNRMTEWQKTTCSTSFAIKAASEAVGIISLSRQNVNEKSARIGYWLASKYWNKGICSFAFSEVLKFGIQQGFKIFRAKIPKETEASLRIWKKHNAKIENDGETHFKVEIHID